jgi:hypothetical protein
VVFPPKKVQNVFQLIANLLALRPFERWTFVAPTDKREHVHTGSGSSSRWDLRPLALHGNHPYCHAVITHAGVAASELHQGVRVQGLSQTPHECDVVLLDQNATATSRATATEPGTRAIRLAVECKFCSSNLGLELLREFIGLASEFGRKPTWLATNSTSYSLQPILQRHNLRWEDEMAPGEPPTHQFIHEVRTLLDHMKP